MSAQDVHTEEELRAYRAALEHLPDPRPRPEGELPLLRRIWQSPKGWAIVSDVNNSTIGIFYTGAALLFFVLAGVLALLIRAQLALPLNDFIGQATYNQLFTMHGTMMMFLFAVPAMESVGVLLLPQMLAARDLPFPRLSAFAFWAYFIGGLAFFCSLLFGVAPDQGWTMYPPLSSFEQSPGIGADFWLLGIGFIEISAIAGAVEIVIGTLRTRAPGMTLDKLPVFGWTMLVFAGMIVAGFPAIILSTILLELERALHWPFFVSELGGTPLLWQHLFWFFGHPEVYIIFLPAAGLLSMIVPTVARTPLLGYRLVVLAILSIAFFSFGVWAHHMFATGLPMLSLSVFSAASMAVAMPAGIQVFAWIGTLALAKKMRWNAPALFAVGAIATFAMGGLTGVMVALVPFDWQAHDTHFVVAHLHYVLIGGMVMPLFAALYMWAPMISRRPLNDRLGRWAFWLMFSGFHITFLPMHVTGMAGMPRRVFTYQPYGELAALNLVSSLGALLIAAGVAVFLYDLVRNFRYWPGQRNAGNVYHAGTLEWLPSDVYGVRSMPVVNSRDPLWDMPQLAEQVARGQWFLPGAPTGQRETIVVSAIHAVPQYLMQLSGPGWPHVLAAVGVAGFFLSLTVKWYVAGMAFGLLGIASIYAWVWDLDLEQPGEPVEVGGGLRLPVGMHGPKGHAWWAMAVLDTVLAMVFACMVFSYFFLWSQAPARWMPHNGVWPELRWLWVALAGLIASFVLVELAGRALAKPARSLAAPLLLAGSFAAFAFAFGVDLWSLLATGLDPKANAYGATVVAISALTGALVAALALMVGYVLVRWATGRLHARRRAAFDVTRQLLLYALAQSAIGLLLVRGFPLVAA